MKKQIFISNAEKAAGCWNKRLDEALKKRGYSQHKFKTELNKHYGTNFTQAMISDWLHVGEPSKRKDGTERHIGFPVYTNMLIIADFLNVDVGYLTGETDMETFTVEKVSQYINLSEKSINAIKRITENRNFYYEKTTQNRITALNTFFSTNHFTELIDELVEMQEKYDGGLSEQDPLIKLYDDLGEKLFEKAMKWRDVTAYDEGASSLSEKEIEAIMRLNKAIDDSRTYNEKRKSLEHQQFSLQFVLMKILSEMFPNS